MRFFNRRSILLTLLVCGSVFVLIGSSVVYAEGILPSISLSLFTSESESASTSTSVSTPTLFSGHQRIANIQNKGNLEINRRLTTLGVLTGNINAATKLTASDKIVLSNEVSDTISGLSNLEVQLDGDTTLAGAHNNALSIYSEYRVYALVVPKVWLIKVADDQQATEAKLAALVPKLQSRITVDLNAGKNVVVLQAELNDMSSKITAAQAISSNIESTVINLQPADYNSNHTVLVGDFAQLQTAQKDILAAYQDAKNIVTSLKTL